MRTATASVDASSMVRIEPSRGWAPLRLAELWEYRELLYFLTWRDVRVRYKQTALGGAWAILQPLFGMVVFSLFFGRLAKMPSDGVPYPIFAYAALVPWTFFANGVTQASQSLTNGANLVRKVYFPRLLLPAASVLSGTVDLLVAFVVLIGMMFAYGAVLSPRIFAVPLLVVLAAAASVGVGLWLSALNVEYRDVRHAVPFLIQAWLFSTPIAYPSTLVPAPWRTVYGLNPMAGVVEGFRWALVGTNTAPGGMILASSLVALALLTGGAFYFRRVEKRFADIV